MTSAQIFHWELISHKTLPLPAYKIIEQFNIVHEKIRPLKFLICREEHVWTREKKLEGAVSREENTIELYDFFFFRIGSYGWFNEPILLSHLSKCFGDAS